MPASLLICPACEYRVSGFDPYCGVCGTVLARLRWSTPEEEGWHAEDGHVAVRAGTRVARVRFRNEGVVPAGLVLRAVDIERLPDWIDREAMGETVLPLLPGTGTTELEIPLVPARLALLFETQEEENATANDSQRYAHLPLLTNLNELRDGRWTSRPFRLTLLAAHQPWISPACSLYRFLPVERLAGEGLEHRIELHNRTLQALDLTDIEISDDPSPGPPGYFRIPAADLLRRDTLERQRIEAGAIWSDVLLLSTPGLPAEALGSEPLGWFSILVKYRGDSADGREHFEILGQLEGRVGRGPTLQVKGPSSLVIPLERMEQLHAFTLENPGQIPVAIESIEVLGERDGEEELAPEHDWLSLAGLAAGDVLGPGEVRTVGVRLVPSQRTGEELDSEYCNRRIRIRHDGLQIPVRRALDLEVSARFGKAEEFTAGIDFGTTNSVVCIGGTKRAYALRLEFNRNQESDRIRSLMLFDGSARGNADEQFLFGEEAFDSAAIRPENLVRSIKTVVARNPHTKYIFFKRIPGVGEQRVTKTPQELLNLFISKLRALAEKGVRYLTPAAFDDLGLDLGTIITLSGAVFSHPVGITEEGRQALMEAAHRAGINESMQEVDDFFEQSCIDEATAAVLAYVKGRVQEPPIFDLPVVDRERVLCFDMGGGTTDLATVEVLNMASYRTDLSGNTRVVVHLEAKTGSRFGGDDLDELLAFLILDEVRRQSEERGDPLRMEDFERAIKSRSRSDFRTDFLLRHAAAGGLAASEGDTRTEDEALGIYALANLVRLEAEKAKCRLSSEEFVMIHLPGTGWQRQRNDNLAEAVTFDVRAERADFETKVRQQILARLPLLDSVVSGAGWEWPSVTTLLLTGQSSRVPVIREEVVRHVEERRGPEASPLFLIEPGSSNFDPKDCVATGAAIWGATRKNGSWLEIGSRASERLTFDLEIEMGPRLKPVPGLLKGQALPAEGAVQLKKGAKELKLYRDGGREPHVKFRFPPVREAGALKVRVQGPSDYSIFVDGKEIKGEVRT